MFSKYTYGKLYNLYLVIGVLSFILLLVETILIVGEHLFPIHFSDFWHNVFVAWFLIGHLMFLKNYAYSKELFNVEELFGYLIVTGFVVLFFSSLPEIFFTLGWHWTEEPLTNALFHLFTSYLYVFYFISALMLFKKLMYVKKNRTTIFLWNAFNALMIVSAFAGFSTFKIPHPVIYSFLFICAIVVFLLMTQLKWIALLKYKTKLYCIGMLLIINLVSLRFAFNFLTDLQEGHIFNSDVIRNVFILLIISSVIIYGLHAMLALLFNLPVASVFEQKESEIGGFNEINKIIQNKINPKEILEVMFNASLQNTSSEGGWLVMQNGEEEIVLKEFGVTKEEMEEINRSIITFQLLNTEKNKKYFYSPNIWKDDNFFNVETHYKSLLVYPILSSRKIVGKLLLLKPYRSGYDEYMINLVQNYIDQANLAFQNSQLISETIEGERLKRELQIAKKIQRNLLPQSFPENLFFEISAASESAQEVGGDYYDFYMLDKNNYALVIGDVSGKGTSAVFHMAEMKGIFQTLVPLGLTPQEFVLEANMAVSRCFEKNIFITLSYLLIRCYQHKITYVRGGHCPILYYHAMDKNAEYLKDEGIGLGIIRDKEQFSKYTQVNEIRFYTNDVLVLYTDGVIDSRNQDGEEYGYERLKTQLEKYNNLSAEEIKYNMLHDLKRFIGITPRIDDLTLLVLKFS